MVLSDRIDQLDILFDMVVKLGIPASDVGVFKGGMRDEDRVFALSRPIVMSSFGMANEGVDKKEADTCILATPKSRVVQCIGRVQRPCETKKSPLVLDIVDEVSIFAQLRWTRQRLYTKEKYQVQVLPHDAPDTEWFS
jgi:superfamily II DNA or RNA helicase